jgi:hypothetical protein
MRTLKSKASILFALAGAVIVLWQLLLPGYVLTLDMVFGPNLKGPVFADVAAAIAPLRLLLQLVALLLSVWVIQKLILFILFFVLFYFPLRFYPFENKYGEKYFASIFYAVNPFVYERLLAGQWLVLAAYALLPPFIHFAISFYKGLSWRSAFKMFGWLLLIGVFSLHFLVMGAILLALILLAALAKRRWEFVRKFALSGILFLLISSYWIVPYMVHRPSSRLNTFSEADRVAFQTAGDPKIGTLGNVAVLHGFWGEAYPFWRNQFIIPKDHTASLVGFGIIGVLVLIGLGSGIKDPHKRYTVLFLAASGFVAVVFSSGIGETVFESFNNWIFEHVWFWGGFRDTEKWSGILVYVYAMLGALGVQFLASLKREQLRKVAVGILCAVPLLATYPLLFGLHGQLKPVWYPEAWAQVNEILKQDKDCKAVFLPWHQYYALEMNNRILTANPSQSYFDCEIVSSTDPEIGNITDQNAMDPRYVEIYRAVVLNEIHPEEAVRMLKEQGIKYIIRTPDVAEEDQYSYPLLKAKNLDKVFINPSIDLYSVRL